jgi:hypothetical protein
MSDESDRMSYMTWTPFGVEPENHPTLVDGVPEWMHSSLREVFSSEFRRFIRTSEFGDGHFVSRVDRMRAFDLVSRGRPFADLLASTTGGHVFNTTTDTERLQMIDWMIKDNTGGNEEGIQAIAEILHSGGSKWMVGLRNGLPGLQARVPEGVQDAADAAMAVPGDSGRLLSEAWQAVYGLNPQPDLGYRKSIDAVEAVVLPLVKAGDDTATLGKAIGQMRAEGDWKLPFIKEHKDNPSEKVVLSMMQALWSGHSDRHPGTGTYLQSTQEAAEAAVSLAVTLVNLFNSGAVKRRIVKNP